MLRLVARTPAGIFTRAGLDAGVYVDLGVRKGAAKMLGRPVGPDEFEE
jgi:hypothetical protein